MSPFVYEIMYTVYDKPSIPDFTILLRKLTDDA